MEQDRLRFATETSNVFRGFSTRDRVLVLAALYDADKYITVRDINQEVQSCRGQLLPYSTLSHVLNDLTNIGLVEKGVRSTRKITLFGRLVFEEIEGLEKRLGKELIEARVRSVAEGMDDAQIEALIEALRAKKQS